MTSLVATKYAFWLLLALSLLACSNNDDLSPEENVKIVINNIESAIEGRTASGVFEHVSDSFIDHRGNNRKALMRIARVYFLRHQNISLISTIQDIQLIDDTTVTVEAAVLMGGTGSSGRLSELRADSQQVSAVFQLEKDNWKLVSISWK